MPSIWQLVMEFDKFELLQRCIRGIEVPSIIECDEENTSSHLPTFFFDTFELELYLIL